MKYIVKRRSWTVPTKIFDRSGWRDSMRFTRWQTLEAFDSYAEARAYADTLPLTGLAQHAVFWAGKPIREVRNAQGGLLEVLRGADALRRHHR